MGTSSIRIILLMLKLIKIRCPISPMESYTYIFNADNEGTHWYHSHSGNIE